MADKKTLNTATNVLKSSSSGGIGIYTYYLEGEEIFFFISNHYLENNNVLFLENELGYSKVGYDNMFFNIDREGNLIVSAENAGSFYIDDNGYLCMVYEEEIDDDYTYMGTSEGEYMQEADSSNLMIEV